MSFIYMFIMLFPLTFYEQDTLFPINGAGKIAFEEEVKVDNLGKEALFMNAVSYATKVQKAGQRKAGKPRLEKDALRKEGSFYVYTKGLFTPQIHGEIKFNLFIEVTDQGYKYTFTDFIFQFYERNRYGQFAPVSGKVKPLEEEKYAGMQKKWLEHKKFTKEVIENHIRVLKKKMQEIPPGTKVYEDDLVEEMN